MARQLFMAGLIARIMRTLGYKVIVIVIVVVVVVVGRY